MAKYAFEFTPQQEKELIKIYLNDAKKNGITSANDMKPYFHGDVGKIETYAAAIRFCMYFLLLMAEKQVIRIIG
jgi:hypothetical protein